MKKKRKKRKVEILWERSTTCGGPFDIQTRGGAAGKRYDRSFRNDSSETLVTRNALTRCKWDIAANGQYFFLSLSLPSFLSFLPSIPFLFFFNPYRRVPLIDYRSSLSIVSTYLHRSTESCISCLTVEVGSKFSSVALKGLDDKSLGQIPYKALSAARRLKGSWVRTPGVRIIIWLHSDAFHF